MHSEMNRMFDEMFGGLARRGGGRQQGREPSQWSPALDVLQEDGDVLIRAELPGVKPEDVEITVTGDMLTISGTFHEEREQKGEQYLFQELRRGRFTRSIALPAALDRDAATANFEDGLLTLTIPKAEETKPRQIRINPTSHASNAQPVGPGRDREAGSQTASQQPADAGGDR